jgi:hypothetical protein
VSRRFTNRISDTRSTPFAYGSAPLDSPSSQRNPRYCDWVVGRSILLTDPENFLADTQR